jgi:hypothetical protein
MRSALPGCRNLFCNILRDGCITNALGPNCVLSLAQCRGALRAKPPLMVRGQMCVCMRSESKVRARRIRRRCGRQAAGVCPTLFQITAVTLVRSVIGARLTHVPVHRKLMTGSMHKSAWNVQHLPGPLQRPCKVMRFTLPALTCA